MNFKKGISIDGNPIEADFFAGKYCGSYAPAWGDEESEELVNLGYTNVKEFGGIIDWPYEIVK